MTVDTNSLNKIGTEDNRVHFQSFVKDDESKAVIEVVVNDLMLPEPKFKKGGISEAIKYLSEHRSPRLLIVDISGSELPISEVNELAEVCEPGVTVIAIGDRNDVGLFRDLTQAGIFDYIVKPVTATLLQRSFITSAEGGNAARQTGRLGKVHAIVGARGGAGATTLLTSSAWHIAHSMKRRVAIVDLDLQFGSIALSLDLEPNAALRDAMEDPSRIDSLFIDRAMLRKSETLFVLSSEDGLDQPAELDWDGIEALLSQLQSRFHYVFLDVPRHTNLFGHIILNAVDELTLVSDSSLAGLRDTIRMSEFVSEHAVNCSLHYAVNKIGEHKRGEITIGEFENGIGQPIDFKIPFDGQNVAFANNSGVSIFDVKNSKLTKEIVRMSETLMGNRKIGKKGFLPSLTFWK